MLILRPHSYFPPMLLVHLSLLLFSPSSLLLLPSSILSSSAVQGKRAGTQLQDHDAFGSPHVPHVVSATSSRLNHRALYNLQNHFGTETGHSYYGKGGRGSERRLKRLKARQRHGEEEGEEKVSNTVY